MKSEAGTEFHNPLKYVIIYIGILIKLMNSELCITLTEQNQVDFKKSWKGLVWCVLVSCVSDGGGLNDALYWKYLYRLIGKCQELIRG